MGAVVRVEAEGRAVPSCQHCWAAATGGVAPTPFCCPSPTQLFHSTLAGARALPRAPAWLGESGHTHVLSYRSWIATVLPVAGHPGELEISFSALNSLLREHVRVQIVQRG